MCCLCKSPVPVNGCPECGPGPEFDQDYWLLDAALRADEDSLERAVAEADREAAAFRAGEAARAMVEPETLDESIPW